MGRQLIVLGTASQAPTRERNHNGYVVRWGAQSLLFDPGEGTQRQMVVAGVKSSSVSHICITHRHGDHTLGLPGVLQRMILDQRRDPVTVMYPVEASRHVDALIEVADIGDALEVVRRPLSGSSTPTVALDAETSIVPTPLDHRVPTLGYRIQEADQTRLDPERLAAFGLSGPVVGDLLRDGSVRIGDRTVHHSEVSVTRPGQAVAVVMDTRVCPAIAELVRDVDLALMEATYLKGDAELAKAHGHLTAQEAASIAADVGVSRLVLTHFSQRYPDLRLFEEEAGRHHHDVIVARDLDRVDVPTRRVTSDTTVGPSPQAGRQPADH